MGLNTGVYLGDPYVDPLETNEVMENNLASLNQALPSSLHAINS